MGNIDKSGMATRQKELEKLYRNYLPSRGYSFVRVDGRAFHTWTSLCCVKPYDPRMIEAMRRTALALCEGIDGAVLAYTQSDEITICFTDFTTPTTQQWFAGQIQKIVSNSAAIATYAFNKAAEELFGDDLPPIPALFDARAWSAGGDRGLAAENFTWRQADAIRNSVSMLAQANFSHKELQNKKQKDMLDMLVNEKGVNWNDEPASFKRGSVVVRRTTSEPKRFFHKGLGEWMMTEGGVERGYFSVEDAPIFTRDGFLIDVLPEIPALDMAGLQQRSR